MGCSSSTPEDSYDHTPAPTSDRRIRKPDPEEGITRMPERLDEPKDSGIEMELEVTGRGLASIQTHSETQKQGPSAKEESAAVDSNEVLLNVRPEVHEQIQTNSDAVDQMRGLYILPISDETIRRAFLEADGDKDGVLSLVEVASAVKHIMGIHVSDARLEGLLNCATASPESFQRLCKQLGSDDQHEELEEAWSLVRKLRVAAAASPSSAISRPNAEQSDDAITLAATAPKQPPDARTPSPLLRANTGPASMMQALAKPMKKDQNKFASTKFATFASVETFFAGLEGLIGTPSSDFMTAMGTEHKSTDPFQAWNANKQRETTPRKEWEYVTHSRVNLEEQDELFMGRDQLPERELLLDPNRL